MKIAILQSSYLGFFPRFFQNLTTAANQKGDTVLGFMPNSGRNRKCADSHIVLFGTKWNWFLHHKLYLWTGLQDIWSIFSTLDLIKKIKAFDPDVVNLHNVNECCLCFPLLVHALNRMNKPVVWTFHDTRCITARCASFEEDQCAQWKGGCHSCTPRSIYEPSHLNSVYAQWKLKKKWFNRLNNLTIVTPSQWLANHVKGSYFENKPIRVLHNGIDTTAFSYSTGLEVEALKGTTGKILLGVAVGWEHRKGLDSMIWLSKHLPEDHHIVLVGGVRPDLVSTIPNNIICLPRTNSKDELIAIFQRADVYVNPTLADNFPTVNIEALGAGLPVVTFRTGGAAECLNEKCGISVPKEDNEAMLEAIMKVTSHPEIYTRENSIERSKDFSLVQFEKYIELYHELVSK